MPTPSRDACAPAAAHEEGAVSRPTDNVADLLQAVADARTAITAADQARVRAEESRRAAIVAAVDAGVSRAEIVRAAGITRARLYQILNNTR